VATATELILEEQMADLKANADLMGWSVTDLGAGTFVLGVPAKDDSILYWRCETDGFTATPPAWRWSDSSGQIIDSPSVTGRGGNFFHSNGVVCAPWNRLAYKSVDGRGPHGDWLIGDWLSNVKTRQCVTLAAMASRLALEARISFSGRAG
jgi:hypothetical protein